MSHPPQQRTCIGCRQIKHKSELTRIVLIDDELIADPNNQQSGRGVYLCKNKACYDLAIKQRAFSYRFRRKISTETIVKLSSNFS